MKQGVDKVAELRKELEKIKLKQSQEPEYQEYLKVRQLEESKAQNSD